MDTVASEHSVDAVANFFIDKARSARCADLTPMKLQKLIYYAQGWHLAIFDRPLFNNSIEAWPWGPVIPRVYHEFKEFGDSPVNRKARELSDDLTEYNPQIGDDPSINTLLDNVWMNYGEFSPIQLSNKTHKPGAPWDQIRAKFDPDPVPKGMAIPQKIMADYFKRVRAGEIAD